VFANTAARVTAMKSAPNVFPRSRCGKRSCVEEDIVDWDNFTNLGELYMIVHAMHHLTVPTRQSAMLMHVKT